MQIIRPEGFGRSNLETTPHIEHPEVSETVQQTLSKLMGYFPSGLRWNTLQCDTDGRLLVTSGSSKTDTGTASQATVGVAQVTLLAANPNRRAYAIKNLGAVTVILGFGSAVVFGTGYPLLPNQEFADDIFTGAVQAVAGSGSNDVRILEF